MRSLTIFPALFLTLAGCNRPASDTSNPPHVNKAPAPLATSPRNVDIAITRANFSSLEFDTNLGTTKSETRARMRVGNGPLTVSDHDGRKYTAPYSRAELDALLEILNTAKFPTLSGSYIQPRLYDAVYETVSLTLRRKDKDGKPLVFTVDNYGNHASPAYEKVSSFLSRLRERKFPSAAFESISG